MNNRIHIEPDLVKQVHNGSSRAFEKLVNKLMKPAYYHALALVGLHDDAVEVSQQAFIRAWNAREVMNPTMPFYPWFYTILKRLCLNAIRDRNRGREIALSMMPDWIEPAGMDDPSKDVLRSEQSRMLQDALSRLHADDREIIVLKDLSGHTYREIADLLHIPNGTVMSRLYTARRRLKNEMEKAGYEYT